MSLNQYIVKILAETSIFMEFSDEEVLNPDIAIAFMENMSANLKELPATERAELLSSLTEMSNLYSDNEQKQFLREFGANFGLTE